MSWHVEIKRSALKSLSRLPLEDQQRIGVLVDKLAIEPRPPGVRKLTGGESLYRLRVGQYRVIYEIRDRQLSVMVVKIGHRQDVYR